MKIEIESAANFLQNLLRLHSSELIVDRLEVFREALLNALTLHYKEHWFPDRPFKGSGYRCLRINHKMDPVITKAGLTCGLDESSLKSLLPNELTLWIDPKEVSYRIGENGSICVLYDADNHVTKPEASREGIPRSTPTKKLPSSLEDGQTISRANTCSPTNSSLSSTPSSLSSPSTSSSPDWCLRDNSSPVSANHQIASTTIQPVTPSTTLKMNPSEVRYAADNHNLNFVINSSMSVNPNQAAVVSAVPPSTPIVAAAAAAATAPAPPPASSLSTVTVNSNTNCRPSSANTASNLNHWTYAYHWQPSSRIENYGSYHHQTPQYPIHQNRRPTCQQSIQLGHTTQAQLHHNKSPTSYTGYTSWDNFIFDKGVTSRHTAYHALNTNIEQLSAYVSG